MPLVISDHYEYVTVDGERWIMYPDVPEMLPDKAFNEAVKLHGVEPYEPELEEAQREYEEMTATIDAQIDYAEEPSDEWTVAELKDYAEVHEIDISGLRLKAEILAAVLGS